LGGGWKSKSASSDVSGGVEKGGGAWEEANLPKVDQSSFEK